MREDYYADYYEFEKDNWWFVSRRRILRALVKKFIALNPQPAEILDAGCGTGINLEFLSQFGQVTGVDRAEEAIRFCRMRDGFDVRQSALEELPFGDSQFDLVTALDVLEHIEDDEKALGELARVCKPGGYLLITVPVFPSLWGEHDEINQHVRRYEPHRLLDMMQQNGLKVIHKSFMNTWLLPGAFLWRWFRKIRRRFIKPENRLARADNMHHHPFFNFILTCIFSSELPLVTTTGIPIGLSLTIVAKKSAN